MAECMIKLLKKNGKIIIEVQYLLSTLKDLTFDNIYHEHYNYWSVTSLINFFSNLPVKIFRVQKINTHGGSIRVFLTNDKNKKVDKSVNKMLRYEEEFGIKKFTTYQKFGERVYQIRKNVINNVNKIKKNGTSIIGYGSPAKATTALNFFGIKDDHIDFIIEDNKLKNNKFIPGTKIPIYSSKKVNKKNFLILVLAWNFFNEIKLNNPEFKDRIISIKDLEKNDFKY